MSHRNRLADQASPYLRQHADNPVDWFPWGDEAFERARLDDKPILLSVGYSSCHWCHVMAHESFEDPDTAALLNERFVNVKVDREERPDVDAVYMEAVQAMTGHGGWPMTVFLLPDGRPFYGGTYFPKVARGGMLAFTDLCRRIDELWHTRRHDLEEQAGELADALRRELTATGEEATGPGAELVQAAIDELADRFDPDWGGFGQAPKFPQPANLDLLLRVAARTGDHAPLAMATTTLDAMASGGIYDHLGGGFARYSTDRRWIVPHFEKMLYDNALLAGVYLHAWQLTGQASYRQVVEETIGYVLRDLRLADGGLASAEDADSEGVEGRFSVWTDDELHDVLAAAGLTADEIDQARRWWGVSGPAVFEGSHILWRPTRGDLRRPPAVERARQALFDHRARRVRPGLDDKALTEWNALFLSSLAEAATATANDAWRDEAVTMAEFLLTRLRRPDGRWLRAWQAGVTPDEPGRPLAFAADLAAVVDAFTRLGEATGQARWTAEAVAAADQLLELFWDDVHGGLFTVGLDAPQLFTRLKDLTDTATPSANSTAALAFVRLWARTGATRYRDAAEAILRLVGPVAAHHPAAFGRLLAAADLLGHGVREVVIAGDGDDLVAVVHATWRPQVVLAWGEADDTPLWAARPAGPDGRGLAHVCEDFTCQRPVSSPAELAALLDRR